MRSQDSAHSQAYSTQDRPPIKRFHGKCRYIGRAYGGKPAALLLYLADTATANVIAIVADVTIGNASVVKTTKINTSLILVVRARPLCPQYCGRPGYGYSKKDKGDYRFSRILKSH
jgi:hypothetical protein